MSGIDRLPQPLHDDAGSCNGAERASAAPARVVGRRAGAGLAPEAGPAHGSPRGLRELQVWMVAAITGEDQAPRFEVVTAGPRMSAEQRFDIYRSSYASRLIECLLDDYPVLAHALGDERFESLCHAYIARHPSRSPNLNLFGRQMPAFCRDEPPSALGELSVFCADLAALEWALVEVLHAREGGPLDLGPLSALPVEAWGDARFTPSEAVRLLSCEYPVNAYFQAVRTGSPPALLPGPSPTSTAVYRRGLSLWRMDLTPAMTRVLRALLGGRPLGEALGELGGGELGEEAEAEAERSVMVWFREWVSCGLFAGVSIPAAPDER